jgi:peptide deformylase
LKTITNCFKHDNPLIKRKLKEVTIEEGERIATELFQILNERKDGVGLAANQVGIDAQVAVVNVKEPIVLINPKIVESYGEIPYYEGCLSFPKKGVHTSRFETVHIQSAQSESGWIFTAAPLESEGLGSWERNEEKQTNELRLLETVCIQHEIDHLNGVTIMDRVRDTTIRSAKKIGRNKLVTIKRGDVVKVMKYKRADKFLSEGWEIDWNRTIA